MPGWAKASNLSELIRDNLRLIITCKACEHAAEPDIMQLRRNLQQLGGYREDLKDLPRYLSCSMCGEKAVKVKVVANKPET